MNELTVLKVYTSHHEAEMAKGLLEGQGIYAHISADDCGGFRPEFTALHGVKLLVKKDEINRALEAIKVLECEVDEL